jgi:CarD family transcriptional regulator
MFKVGDKVACPPHGVGVIEKREVRRVKGKEVVYLRISIIGKNFSILIPETSATVSGVRHVICKEEVNQIMKLLSTSPRSTIQKWTVRHRTNIDRLRSGSAEELAVVVRNLTYRLRKKGLSYSEKKLLEEAFFRLAEEIALSLEKPLKEVVQEMKKALRKIK